MLRANGGSMEPFQARKNGVGEVSAHAPCAPSGPSLNWAHAHLGSREYLDHICQSSLMYQGKI